MKISLFVVGKTVDKHLNSLIEEYTQRIGHYTPFDITIFPDIKSSKSMPPSVIKEKEGALLLQNMRPGDCIILLDERGKEYRKRQSQRHDRERHRTGILRRARRA